MYKLLLVDDEEEIVLYLKDYFNHNCQDFFEIYTALTVKRSLEILETEEIDVMLCDVNLTDGSGLDLMNLVLDKYQHTKILMLSGQSNFEQVYEIQKQRVRFISKLETEEYILQIIQEELMGDSDKEPLKDEKNIDDSNNIISFLFDYIDKHYSEELTLDNLSKLVFMNPSYLSRFFKKTTGKSLFEYVNEIRIKKSIELLADPANKLKDIYKLVGYSTPNYYNRVFKLKLGLSPKQYRRTIINSDAE